MQCGRVGGRLLFYLSSPRVTYGDAGRTILYVLRFCSHAGNVLFPRGERMQSAILAIAKCHTGDCNVRNHWLQSRFWVLPACFE